MSNSFVLIIENDLDLCNMVAHTLKPYGCAVFTAQDGSKGLAILHEITPTLVILDLSLPYVPGEKIIHYIRNEPRLKNTKIMLVTIADLRKIDKVQEQVDRVFQKPYPLDAFRDALDHLLGAPAAS
jgi:DNA-binding response OmpR family regulator